MELWLTTLGLYTLILIYFLMGAVLIAETYTAARSRDLGWIGIMIEVYIIWMIPIIVIGII